MTLFKYSMVDRSANCGTLQMMICYTVSGNEMVKQIYEF